MSAVGKEKTSLAGLVSSENTLQSGIYFTAKTTAKKMIVFLALRGFMSHKLADLLIQKGGLRHD